MREEGEERQAQVCRSLPHVNAFDPWTAETSGRRARRPMVIVRQAGYGLPRMALVMKPDWADNLFNFPRRLGSPHRRGARVDSPGPSETAITDGFVALASTARMSE